MATTATCAWIFGRWLFIANVGDSRIYLIRKGHIHQISVDHTWLQEALEAGLISRADFKGHPQRTCDQTVCRGLRPLLTWIPD